MSQFGAFGPDFFSSSSFSGAAAAAEGAMFRKRWFTSGSVSEKLCRANSTKFISNGCRQRRENTGTRLRLITRLRLVVYLIKHPVSFVLSGDLKGKVKGAQMGDEVQFIIAV